MPVTRETEGPVARVTLDRPSAANSLDVATMRELRDQLEAALADEATDALVLAARGEAFCTGADLGAFADALEDGEAREVVHELSSTMNEAILAIVEADAPVVAQVDGVAAGGGLGLALACDVRVASRRARFTPAFLGVGVAPDGGATWFLPRMLGDARARDVLLRNRVIGAQQAEAWGLVSDVVGEADVAERTRDLARGLADGPAQATAWAKERLARADALREHLAWETEATAASADTDDFREGVEAFLEGREPDFD